MKRVWLVLHIFGSLCTLLAYDLSGEVYFQEYNRDSVSVILQYTAVPRSVADPINLLIRVRYSGDVTVDEISIPGNDLLERIQTVSSALSWSEGFYSRDINIIAYPRGTGDISFTPFVVSYSINGDPGTIVGTPLEGSVGSIIPPDTENPEPKDIVLLPPVKMQLLPIILPVVLIILLVPGFFLLRRRMNKSAGTSIFPRLLEDFQNYLHRLDGDDSYSIHQAMEEMNSHIRMIYSEKNNLPWHSASSSEIRKDLALGKGFSPREKDSVERFFFSLRETYFRTGSADRKQLAELGKIIIDENFSIEPAHEAVDEPEFQGRST